MIQGEPFDSLLGIWFRGPWLCACSSSGASGYRRECDWAGGGGVESEMWVGIGRVHAFDARWNAVCRIIVVVQFTSHGG